MACQDRKPCSTRWPGFGQQEGTENDMRVKKTWQELPWGIGVGSTSASSFLGFHIALRKPEEAEDNGGQVEGSTKPCGG